MGILGKYQYRYRISKDFAYRTQPIQEDSGCSWWCSNGPQPRLTCPSSRILNLRDFWPEAGIRGWPTRLCLGDRRFSPWYTREILHCLLALRRTCKIYISHFLHGQDFWVLNTKITWIIQIYVFFTWVWDFGSHSCLWHFSSRQGLRHKDRKWWQAASKLHFFLSSLELRSSGRGTSAGKAARRQRSGRWWERGGIRLWPPGAAHPAQPSFLFMR